MSTLFLGASPSFSPEASAMMRIMSYFMFHRTNKKKRKTGFVIGYLLSWDDPVPSINAETELQCGDFRFTSVILRKSSEERRFCPRCSTNTGLTWQGTA
jgi:hypothetical protein